MTKLASRLAAIALAVATSTVYAIGSFACGGSGSDCNSACEDVNSCSTDKVDCDKACSAFEAITACTSKLDKMDSCYTGASNACTDETCSKEFTELATCVESNCKGKTDANCMTATSLLGD